MKALILAAGYGKRLRPLTDSLPKSLVEVDGTPLLVNALNHLTALGVREIGIVVGHMAGTIRARIGSSWQGVPVTYFENRRYLETNNVVSLYEALPFLDDDLDDDLLLLECDLFYRRELLETLLTGKGDCSILVSPFDPETMDGTVIRVEGDRAMELIPGAWQGEGFDYSDARKTVNLYRFSHDFVRKKYAPLVRWYVENMGENSYYEKVLGSLIYYRECDIRVVEVPADTWCEIDDLADLHRARARFGGEPVEPTAPTD